MVDVKAVQARATQMRKDIVEMIAEAGSGHPGGSLSAADIVATLYFGDVLRHGVVVAGAVPVKKRDIHNAAMTATRPGVGSRPRRRVG